MAINLISKKHLGSMTLAEKYPELAELDIPFLVAREQELLAFHIHRQLLDTHLVALGDDEEILFYYYNVASNKIKIRANMSNAVVVTNKRLMKLHKNKLDFCEDLLDLKDAKRKSGGMLSCDTVSFRTPDGTKSLQIYAHRVAEFVKNVVDAVQRSRGSVMVPSQERKMYAVSPTRKRPPPLPEGYTRKKKRTKTQEGEVVDEKMAKKLRLRAAVAQELLQTEHKYLANLSKLVEHYNLPLKRNSGVLTSSQCTTLFTSNLPAMLQLHANFYSMLEEEMQGWDDDSCIGPVIKSMAPFFKMYSSYVNNHAAACALQADLDKKSASFRSFCADAKESSGVDLASLLIQPVQRIPRYELFLTTLLKHTPADHKDFTPLQEAAKLIHASASHVNEAVRAHENASTVREIQSHFDNITLLTPSRRFIEQADMKMKRMNASIPVFCFLFNDLLLIAEQKADSNLDPYWNGVGASGISFTELDRMELTELQPAYPGRLGDCTIELSDLTDHAAGLTQFVCVSREERDHWIGVLNEHITLAKEAAVSKKKRRSTSRTSATTPRSVSLLSGHN